MDDLGTRAARWDPARWARRLWSATWDASVRYGPRSRLVAVGVIAGLLAGVTVLRWFFDGAGESVALLYALPITLGSLRFGRRGGIEVACVSMGAFIVLEAVRAKGDLDVTGWAGPLLVMALIGGLVGHLSEVAAQREAGRRVHADRARELEALCNAQRGAIEASDSIVQQVAAARWLLESGRSTEALAALGATVVGGVATVSRMLAPLPKEPEPVGRSTAAQVPPEPTGDPEACGDRLAT